MKVLINKIIVAYRRYGLAGCLLRFSIRWARLLKLKCLELLGFEYTKTYYGVKMWGNWRDITFILGATGAFGTALSDYLKSLQSDFIFLDIGANQGLYSLLAANNKHCTSVIAFEPVAETFELLQKNIEINSLGAKINPIRAAISSKKGKSKIFLHTDHSGHSTLEADIAASGLPPEEVEVVDIKGVDELIRKPIDIFVKIDVEGHEDVVMEELFKSKYINAIQAIFYEMNERWNNPHSIKSSLKKRGFKSFLKYGEGEHYDILALR
jgi:FkbM family methyltransferase